MIYTFGQFELDLAAAELRAGGEVVRVEPQVFALLALLVANGERLVSKDEIIEKVWDGRVVTDADNMPDRMVGIGRDVTAEREAARDREELLVARGKRATKPNGRCV